MAKINKQTGITMMMDLPSADQVADFMLGMAKMYHDVKLDPLQLNKLCYLVNGFVLREREDPAFYDDIEAWKYGPVIPTVYHKYKIHGDGKIPRLAMCRTSLDDREALHKRCTELADIIGEEVAATTRGVLKEYSKFDGVTLMAMTHGKDTPWKKAFKAGQNKVITTGTIKEFYRNLSTNDRKR